MLIRHRSNLAKVDVEGPNPFSRSKASARFAKTNAGRAFSILNFGALSDTVWDTVWTGTDAHARECHRCRLA